MIQESLCLTVLWLFLVLLDGSGGSPITSDPCTGQEDGSHLCDPGADPSRFLQCYMGRDHRFTCQPGLHFDPHFRTCNWPAAISDPCPANTGGAQSTDTVTASTGLHTQSTASTSTTPPTSPTSTTPPSTQELQDTGTTCQNRPEFDTFCNPATGGSTYFTCVWGSMVESQCPAPLTFHNSLKICMHDAQCQPAPPPPPTPPTSPPASVTTTSSIGAGGEGTVSSAPPPGSCNETNCQLPNCRCLGTDIPGAVTVTSVPQMVLLTFDDDINLHNYHYYQGLFPENQSEALTNPNGCRAAATFFVSNGWTLPEKVAALHALGHEMASHSKDHSDGAFWNAAQWLQQMQGMRQTLADTVGDYLTQPGQCGMRAPFLSLGADLQYSMLKNNGFLYDSSMISGSLTPDLSPPTWPFTLDYAPDTRFTCLQGGCPRLSYPGLWQVPIIRQYTPSGAVCSMTDDPSCAIPSTASVTDVKNFLYLNFNRHFSQNRAPFMISMHATWFARVPASFQALQEFLTELREGEATREQVWLVTVTQMLDWVRNPRPMSEIQQIPTWNC